MTTIDNVNISQKQHFAVYCLSNSTWIYKKNIQNKIYPASITKLLTSLIALDYCKLKEKITIMHSPISPQLRADLRVGKKYSIETLLQALLVRSANDVAIILQEYIERKTKKSWSEITKKHCKKLGMTNSCFLNANGLHKDSHYTTMNDLIHLGQVVYQNQIVMNILKMPTCKIVSSQSMNPIILYSTNPFLNKKGVIAGKTGYTPRAGQCLLFYFEKNGKIYIGIIAGTDKEKFQQNVFKTIRLVP